MKMNPHLCGAQTASSQSAVRQRFQLVWRGWVGLAVVMGLLLGGTAVQAQYSGNNQTNMISGVISNWTGNYIVGNTNTSRDVLIVTNAGVLNVSAIAYIGKYTSNNVGIVTGPGSILSNSSTFYVGQYGSSNSLTIANGGLIYNKNAGNIGAYTWASYNSVTVTDPGSVWSNNTAINVGYNNLGWGGAYNTLTITNGGAVFVPMIRIGGSTHTSNNVVTISSGILAVNSIQNYDGSDQLVVAGGTLQPYSTNGAWSAVMVVNNAVTLNTVDLGGQPRTNTLSSTVAGAGVMNITGAGVLRWNGTATGGSVINVTNGTTLAGNGSAATVQIQSNATLAAGTPLGTLTATNLTLVGGAALQVQLNAPTGTKGVDWNLLSVNGPVTLSGISSGAPLTVNVMNSGGLDGVNLPVATRSWDFLDATGITGFDSNAVTITTTGLASWTNGIWSVVQGGNSLQLNYILPPVTISIAANPSAAGAATGGGTYAPGTNVVLTATASNGWVFASWSDSTTNNPHTITVPVTNSTYTANFVVAATVTGNSSTNVGGTVTGGGVYAVGGTAVLTATPSNGWGFAGWDTGVTNNPYSITVPSSNITYTAQFVLLAQLTTLYTFTGGNDGGLPWGALTLSGDGSLLYGMTENYGTNLYYGTAFALGTNGAFTTLHAFTGGNDGGNAYGALTRAGDGTTLFGITSSGGASNSGTAFALGTNGVLTTLYAFTGGDDGSDPVGSLTLSGDGTTLYGMTYQGGVSNAGTAFALGTNGVLTTLYAFTGGDDGGYPNGSVTLSGDGTTLYGMTKNGGSNSVGTAFALGTNGVLTTLYVFAGGNDGASPNGSLILSGNGTTLYGMTQNYGANGYGTVFALGTNTVFTTLYAFTGGRDGGVPKGDLTFSTDGTKLYGMTSAWSGGGGSSDGRIFQMNLDGSDFKTLYSFSGGSDGSDPEGSLILSGDGATLYGMTRSGGGDGDGTAFALVLVHQTPQVAISVTANPTDGGAVTGGGVYATGTNVVLTAIASNDWVFASWSDGSTNNPHSITAPQTNITYTANFAVSNCTYAVASSSTNVAAGASSGSVNLTAGTGCAWTATNNVNWLTITGGSSGIGNGTISYTVANNTGNCTNRIGTLTIGGQIFTVTQAIGSGSYSLAAASTNVLVGAGSGSVVVTAGVSCAWSATVAPASTNWLHTPSSGTGNGTVNFTVDANTANCTNRTGTITVGGQTFSVTQASGSGSYSLAFASTNVVASAGGGSVGITAGVGCAWTATSSSTNWLHTPSSGTGNGTVNFTVDANTANCTNRTGIITVGGQTFSVIQASGSGSYSLAFASTNVAASAGSGSVAVTAGVGCAWTATSSTNWLTTSSVGNGNGTVNFNVLDNSLNCTNRSATITVGGQTFTVTQTTGAGSYSLAAASTNVLAAAGAGSVGITAGVGCTWTATSNTNWLHTTSTGTGSGTISYTFDTNLTVTARSGTITVGGQTFTVSQAASASAMITVQANPVNGGTVSGAGTYVVGSSQSIAATATNGWIFTGWSDGGNTQSPRTITVSATNFTYTANFAVNQFTYTTNNAAITITGYTGTNGVITIPSMINGYPVISIDQFAFQNITLLTSVAIPFGVTSIGDYAFLNCSGLTSVAIPASVTSIGESAFQFCSLLTGGAIPASVTSIGNSAFQNCYGLTSVAIPASVTNIGSQAFGFCSGLSAITVAPSNTVYSSLAGVLFNTSQTALIAYPCGIISGSYTIPSSVTNIIDWAFGGCSRLTQVMIPNSVTSIGVGAFQWCTRLTNIAISANVINIGDAAFAACDGLTAITVASNNLVYSSVAGVLCNKDQTMLLQCPGGRVGSSYTVPTSITSIASNAFYECYKLNSVTISANVTSIGVNAFEYDYNLTNVVIGTGVTTIKSLAFYGCSRLAGVYFNGNAPSLDAGVFGVPGYYDPATAYYTLGTTGWTNPWGGLTTAVWQATVAVTANPANGGTVSGAGSYGVGTNVSITASANAGWTFTSWSDGGAQTHTITVPATNFSYTANFSACTYTLAASSTNVAASAGSGNVGVTTLDGCSWSAVSSTNWIQTSSSGAGSGTINYTFGANPAGLTRSGTITVNGQTFTVNQAAATCTYTLAASSTNVAASAGSGNVGLTTLAGCAWSAVSSTNWIQTTSSGTGNGTVSYAVDANPAGLTRSATITVGGQTFTVNQAAATCTYTLAATSTNVTGPGSGSVELTTLPGCAWTATSTTNWIQTTSSGTGSGTINYTFVANPTGLTRSGLITANGQTFTITQTAQIVPTSLSGSVTNAGTGGPLGGVVVSLGSQQVTTDPNGNYQFSSLTCSATTFTVTANGYTGIYLPAYTPTCQSSNIMNVGLAVATTTFGGQVIDFNFNSGTGISNAGVYWGSLSAGTGNNGNYQVSNAPCLQTTNLIVQAPFYDSYKQPYTPGCGGTNVLLVYLSRSIANLTGTVWNAQTQAGISNAVVVCGTVSALTDPNGAYTLQSYCGTWPLIVSSPISQTYTGSVTVNNFGTNVANVWLTPNPTTFGGQVIGSATSAGLPNAAVSWGNYHTATDANGRYQFGAVDCNLAKLVVACPGYQSSTQNYAAVCGQASVVNVPLTPANLVVTNVWATQQAGNIVAISYNLVNPFGQPVNVAVAVSTNNGLTFNLPAVTFTPTNGSAVTPGNNRSITWAAAADWNNQISAAMVFRVTATGGGQTGAAVSPATTISTLSSNAPPLITDVTTTETYADQTPYVRGIYSNGSQRAFFLNGVPGVIHLQVHTAWNGHAPTQFQVTGTRTSFTQAATNATITIDLGSDLSSGAALNIVAAATDGTKSAPFRVNLDVIPVPPGIPLPGLSFNPALSCYTIPNFNVVEGVAVSGPLTIQVQGPDVPGQTGASFQSQWAMAGKIGLDGSYSANLQPAASTDNWSMAGFAIKPTVTAGMQGQWQPSQNTFSESGSATIAAHYQVATAVKPSVVGLLLPATLKGYVTANQVAGLTFSDNSTNGWQFTGSFPVSLALAVDNSLGYDWNNAQISIVGTITAGFNYPQSLFVSGVSFTIASVVKQQSLVWVWGSQQPPVSTYYAMQPGTTADQFRQELSRRIALALPKRPPTSAFQLMSRDYQHRPVAIKQRAGLVRGRSAKRQDLVAASSGVITRNVFPQSQPQIGVSGTNEVLLWVRDNPARLTENCMELVWQRRQGASWSSPLPVWDNGTGDAEPVVGVLSNGTMLAVWQKQASILPAGTSLGVALTNTVIATALYDPATGLWATANLTNPNGCQHTPHLAVAPDGTALVTWIGNAGDDTLGSVAAPNTVFAQRWNGAGWDPVTVLAAHVPMLQNSTVAYDGSHGVFIATVDGDDNETTQGDQELYGATFADGSWSAFTRLTQNAVQDTKPQARYDSTGRLLVAWYQGSNIVMRAGDLNLQAASVVAKLDGNLSSQDFTLITGPQGQISMVWEDVAADGSGPGPNLVNYDPTLQAWSLPLRLFTMPNELDRAFSGAYATNGALQLAYNAVDVTPVGDTPQFGQVDLMYLDYLIGRDLAVSASDISLAPVAVPGQPVTLSAIIRNIGEYGAANVAVGFYDGDPGNGGQRIGSLQIIPDIFVAGTNVTVHVPWIVPNDNVSHTVYVVVDPALAQVDRNRANNTATLSVLAPDLQITSFTVGQPNATNRLLNATCLNLGAIPTTRSVAVTFRRDAIDGPLLGSALVNPLPTNGVNAASLLWAMAGQTFTTGVVTVYAIVDEAQTMPSASPDHKTRSAAVMVTLDSVGDGIPDWWRARYFGGTGALTNSSSCAACDPNQNGLSNLQEYRSGTNPTDPASHPVRPVIATTNPLPFGTNGVAYSQQFQAYNGVPPYQWSIGSGKLPAGLQLNAASGLLSGKPTVSGISNFRVGVTDSQKLSTSNAFSVLIRNATGVLAGTYTGLVQPTGTNLATHASSGFAQIVLAKTGAYAGNLTLAGRRTAFKGQFDVTGNSTSTVAGVRLVLHADGDHGRITGPVIGTGFTAELLAELPDTSAVWQGKYTLIFSPVDGQATNLPQGFGSATLTVSRTGVGSLRGVLNDGTPVSATAPLLQSGLWPLYASLYHQAGACLGWVSLATDGTVAATVDWFAPASQGYAAFATTLLVDGSAYTTGLLPGIGVPWDVTLSGGGVSNLFKTVTFNAAYRGTVTPAGADAMTLKLTVKTGQITGSFKPASGAAAIPFTGLLLQSQGMGAGLFKTATDQTGGVLLTPVP